MHACIKLQHTAHCTSLPCFSHSCTQKSNTPGPLSKADKRTIHVWSQGVFYFPAHREITLMSFTTDGGYLWNEPLACAYSLHVLVYTQWHTKPPVRWCLDCWTRAPSMLDKSFCPKPPSLPERGANTMHLHTAYVLSTYYLRIWNRRCESLVHTTY